MTVAWAWRGEPIRDIKAWAVERGERMVRYHAERTYPSIITGRIETEAYDDEMPESFWKGMPFHRDGWTYKEIA
jgi:hypothetical protein